MNAFDTKTDFQTEQQLQRYAEDLTRVYREERRVRDKLQRANGQLKRYAESLQEKVQLLGQAKQTLERSQRQYRTLSENIPDIICRIDADMRLLYANPATRMILKVDENPIGQTLDQLPINKRLRRIWIEYGNEVFANGAPRLFPFVLKKDNHSQYFTCLIAPEPDAAGKVQSLVCSFRDISEIKRMESEKQKLEEQLMHNQKMQTIGTMASGIAHDFNNILSPIFGFTEIAIDELHENSAIREDLLQVLAAAQRAKALVRQILNFSRKVSQEPAPLNVLQILHEATNLIRASAPKNIQIDLDVQSHEPYIMADPNRIHQVLMNLNTNAIHAMKDGGQLAIRVEQVMSKEIEALRNLPQGEYVAIHVSDTGHGMSASTKARIFEPFFTTKPADEGTGLGLAVVRGIIESHGGAITVDSAPGRGTRFSVYFPYLSNRQVAVRIDDKIHLEAQEEERILIVDDEPNIVQTLSKILSRSGYLVEGVTSSREAHALLRDRVDHYDLLLTDLTMPDMSGLDLVRALRERRQTLPVIIMTGYNPETDTLNMRDLQPLDILSKPIIPADLKQSIRHALDLNED